jgi:pimeloyl-ACP methyl ester carboxylesterase
MDNLTPDVSNHFIVFIPGYMGSKLRSRNNGKTLWLDFRNLLRDTSNIQTSIDKFLCGLRYPNEDLEPAGIIDQLVYFPPLFKQDHYARFLDAMQKMGYALDTGQAQTIENPTMYTFPYDWRQDNRISARQLGIAIKKWKEKHEGAKVWIVAHSNGGIVARWYIEKEGGKEQIDRLFLLGSPWDGSPKAMQVLFEGPEIFLLKLFNQFNIQNLVRETILSFPSFYQLIPYYVPFLKTTDGKEINPFKDHRWLDTDHQVELLENARQFYIDLETNLSIETLCFFGIKQSTLTGGKVSFDQKGNWSHIDWDETDLGDGTVPLHSAIHEQALEKLPFAVSHGDIYSNSVVLNKLEWEFLGKFSGKLPIQSTKLTQDLIIQFETDSNCYTPDEIINLIVTLRNPISNESIKNAEISVRTEWVQGIPFLSEEPPKNFPFVYFSTTANSSGEFVKSINAPSTPGYYRFIAMIETKNSRPELIKEIILIEPDDFNWYNQEDL